MIYWRFIGDLLGIYWRFIGDLLVIYWRFIGDLLGIYWGFRVQDNGSSGTLLEVDNVVVRNTLRTHIFQTLSPNRLYLQIPLIYKKE